MSTVYGKIERNKRTYQVYAPVEYGGRITMEAYKQEFIDLDRKSVGRERV